MKKITNQPMTEIIDYFETTLKDNKIISIEVLNPDLGIDDFSGTVISLDENYIYHSYKSWTDLSELMFCKMLTPIIISRKCRLYRYEK